MKFNWQKEAIKQQRVLVRACRRAGKTMAAAQWARSARGQTLFLVQYEHEAKEVREAIMALCTRAEIRSYTADEIVFRNGNHIRIKLAGSDQIRGLRVQNLVIEGANRISESDVLEAINRVSSPDFNLYASYTGTRSGAVRLLEKVEGLCRLSVDYLDFLEEGVFKADDVRSLRKMMTAKNFAEEFGPYDKETQETLTNRSLSYLLEQVK